MSMPTYSLSCNRCDFVVGSARLWANRHYLDEEIQFHCHAQFGWCNACSDMVPMEDFGYHSWELEEIDWRAEWLKPQLKTPWQALWNLILPRRRRMQFELMEEIQTNLRALRHANKRRGTERCLECGSREVKPFDGRVDVKIPDGSLVFTGESRTGFIHPGCGGELIAKGSEMRLNIAIETRFYSPDGNLITAYYE